MRNGLLLEDFASPAGAYWVLIKYTKTADGSTQTIVRAPIKSRTANDVEMRNALPALRIEDLKLLKAGDPDPTDPDPFANRLMPDDITNISKDNFDVGAADTDYATIGEADNHQPKTTGLVASQSVLYWSERVMQVRDGVTVYGRLLDVLDTSPYYFWQQFKNIGEPVLSSANDTIPNDGTGRTFSLIPQTNSSGPVLLNRNFATQYEGTLLLEFTPAQVGGPTVNFDLEAELDFIHIIPSAPGGRISSKRKYTVDATTAGSKTITVPMSAFNSNTVLNAPQPTTGVIPFMVNLTLRAKQGLGNAANVKIMDISFEKIGATFFQLADKRGIRGEKGEQGQPGRDGAPGQGIVKYIIYGEARNFDDDNETSFNKGDFFKIGGNVSNGTYIVDIPIAAGTDIDIALANSTRINDTLRDEIGNNRLLPNAGGGGGRTVVDVYDGNAITPEWRDRIIPWGTPHRPSLEKGDIIKFTGNTTTHNGYTITNGRFYLIDTAVVENQTTINLLGISNPETVIIELGPTTLPAWLQNFPAP